jgi:hypothetical protein
VRDGGLIHTSTRSQIIGGSNVENVAKLIAGGIRASTVFCTNLCKSVEIAKKWTLESKRNYDADHEKGFESISPATDDICPSPN